MSRYGDDYDGDSFPNESVFWTANADRALKGRRGRQALRDLREALLALPEPKLIVAQARGAAVMTAPKSGQAAEPELTVSVCEERGHVGHFARITTGYPWHSASFCLLPGQAAFLSQALSGAAGEAAQLRELVRELIGMAVSGAWTFRSAGKRLLLIAEAAGIEPPAVLLLERDVPAGVCEPAGEDGERARAPGEGLAEDDVKEHWNEN